MVASPFTNSVQLRAYLRVDLKYEPEKPVQAFAEFVMHPTKLMQGEAAMKAIAADEPKFSTILSGGDLFMDERGLQPRHLRLKSCLHCHSGWGIHSVNSRAQLFEQRSLLVPLFKEGKPNDNASATIRDKQKTYSWGLLNGLWKGLGS